MEEVFSSGISALHCRESGEAVHVMLGADLTITSAASLHAGLQTILASGKRIELDGGAVEKIDAAVMQLLWACARETTHAAAPLHWIRVSEPLWQAADLLGLAAMMGGKGARM